MAFANSPNSDYLSMLEEEGEIIYRIMMPRATNRHFQIHREQATTIDKINYFLTTFKDRVEVFHYGGHSNSKKIFLKDQDANSASIARQLGLQKAIKLVFLNGCSTKDQVQLLLDEGIPAVIATSAEIGDERAQKFAYRFYKALTEDYPLEEAFEIAKSLLLTADPDFPFYRGFVRDLEPQKPENIFPWGLYIRPDGNSILNWKLPKEPPKVVKWGAGLRFNTKVNESLEKALFEVLHPYNTELQFYQLQLQKGEKIDPRLIRRSIIDSLPSPIGEQIRKLFALDNEADSELFGQIGKNRLIQLIDTYSTMVELLCFIMFSMLREAKHFMGPSFKVSKITREQLINYFKLSEDLQAKFDFVPLIKSISECLEKGESTLNTNSSFFFLGEMIKLRILFYQNTDFWAAYQFMQELRESDLSLSSTIDTDEIENLCVQAEGHLSNSIKFMSLLAEYKFITIKKIDLIKQLHKPPQFKINRVVLDKVTAGYMDVPEIYPYFTDGCSVLLTKSDNSINNNLNLSPFVIDENAVLEKDKSKLFFLNSLDVSDGTIKLKYKFLKNRKESFEISTQSEFIEFKEQLAAFFKLVFNQSVQELISN